MPTPLKLLILEDNAFDAELEVGKLEAAGYECDWQQVQTREEFEASLDRPEFELILADYNLPDFDGLSALGLLRSADWKSPSSSSRARSERNAPSRASKRAPPIT